MSVRLFGNSSSSSVLRCFLSNARSIVNKLSELHYLLYSVCYDCIFVTESWLSPEINNGLLDPQGKYTVMRYDRHCAKGGGVIALIEHSHVVSKVVFDEKYSHLEVIALDVLNLIPIVRIFLIYRPPYCDSNAKLYAELLIDCLSQYTCDDRSNVIMGDLNLPHINWQLLQCPDDHIHKPIYEFILTHGFSQIVDFPTRDANLLDLLLTDDDCLITSVNSCLPLGHSDHTYVEFSLTGATATNTDSNSQCSSCRYRWYDGDYDSMSYYLSNVDWNVLFYHHPSAESMWYAFMDVLCLAINLYVPVSDTNGARRGKSYNSKRLRKCAVRKRKLWNKLRLNPVDPMLRYQYRECVHQWRQILRDDEIAYEQRIIDSGHLGTFYRFVNQFIANRPRVGPIIDEDTILTDSRDKANAFNRYFSSVGVVDNGVVPSYRDIELNSILDSITVDEADVLSSINKLKSTLSAGPD